MHRVNNTNRIRRRSAALAAVAITAVAAGAAVTGSCLPETETFVCASGRRCPAGQVCAAQQDVCIDIGGCGDGLIGSGEVCDDGNIMDDDHCSHDCKSTEICGNGMRDSKEECDDGNLANGDGCSSKCVKEVCGNLNVDIDVGEVCDDGNAVSGDGCSANCKSNEACGNGVMDGDLGEQCEFPDRPFPHHFDDTADCDNDCTLPVCGDNHLNRKNPVKSMRNGSPDHLEECDEGSDSKICNFDCTLAKCGDNYKNGAAGEDCDLGTTQDRPSCDGDCTFPKCGDGHTNPEYTISDSKDGHKEECDLGRNTVNCNGSDNRNGDGNCRLSKCGDGYLNTDSGEICEVGGVGCDPASSTPNCDTSGSNGCHTCKQ